MNNFYLKNGNMNIEDIENAALAIAYYCKDYTVEHAPSNLMFHGDKMLYYPKGAELRNLDIGPVAFGQLCQYTGVPSRYAEKLITNGRKDLFALNMNEGLKEKPIDSTVLVREYKNEIRGFLSSKFSPFDAHEIIANMRKELNFGDFDIKGYGLSENYFHMRVIEKQMLPIEKEDLFPGFSISSSDVGSGALNIDFFVYKKVCSNGLVVPQSDCKLLHMRHIGITKENFLEQLVQVVTALPVMTEKVSDLITKNSEVIYDEEQLSLVVEKIMKDIPTLKTEKQSLLEFSKKYQVGENVTKWNFVNSITEVAQKYDLQKRLEIEKYAGKLLLAA